MMIVQCQACQTRFRVDESRIQGRGARMRCRRCGEAIIVMKDSATRPGAPPPKNLFDLRSVLKQSEREPSRFFEEKTPTPPAQEPEIPETEAVTPPEEPAAGEEPPGVESPDEMVSLRVTEEVPEEETAPEAAEPPFPAQEPEIPETEAVTPPEEPPVPREPEAPAAWEPPAEEPTGPPELPEEPREEALTEPSPEAPAAPPAEEKPFELFLNHAESLDFLKEDYERAGTEGELDISGILRSDPSPDQEPAEVLPPSTPQEPPLEEPMPDRLEAIQRELQEIGGGSPEHAGTPSPSPAAVPSVPPIRKTPPISPRVAARPGKIRGERPSLLPLAVLFLLIAGGGAYLGFTPGGQEILRRMVPALESLWLGGESTEARYSVGNLIGYYEPNTKAGTLFVITGTVTNQGRKKRSGIRVRAELLGSSGEHIAGTSVFAGNVLSGEALRSSSREAIEKGMANRWGDKLSNLDIAPGKSIPFMVVFFNAPAGIEEYRLEVRDGE